MGPDKAQNKISRQAAANVLADPTIKETFVANRWKSSPIDFIRAEVRTVFPDAERMDYFLTDVQPIRAS